MKLLLAVVLSLSLSSAVAETVMLDSITFVDDLDTGMSFDFAAGGVHRCGSDLYRVTTTHPESLDRKFEMILAAVTSGKRIAIDAGECDGKRRLVGWVRVYGD